MTAETTISVSREIRDLLRSYLQLRSSQVGRLLTYDEILRELLDGVGWDARRAKR